MGFQIENGVLLRYTNKKARKAIKIPNGVKIIGKEAFYKYTSMISVVIPDTVTIIERDAFYGCSHLQTVKIPDSVTSIGSYAFENCKSLTAVTLSQNMINIGSWAFAWCESLTAINIPDSVTEIGYDAFGQCKNLKELLFRGCTFHSNFVKIQKLSECLNKIILMLGNNDFSGKFEPEIKYPFLLDYYRRTKNENARRAIWNEVSEIVPYAMEQNDIESIQALTETDMIITSEYIDFFIELAIENQRHEIYLILVNYKAEKLGFKDIKDQFKL